MKKPPLNQYKKLAETSRTSKAAGYNVLRHLAFDNTVQANIITIVSSGKILLVNKAACKLLGYPKKELMSKSRADIFSIEEAGFKKMYKQRSLTGHSVAFVTAIKKSGKLFPCEITSAVFMDRDKVKNAITTISDISKNILKQKTIDSKRTKLEEDNISIAKSKQRIVDKNNDKKVASNIVMVQSNQRKIDIEKEKKVAQNITLAKTRQKNIDTKNEKRVAGNIVLAQAKSDARLKERISQENLISGKLLAKYKESIKVLFNSSTDVLFDSDLLENEVLINDAYERELGYKLTGNRAPADDWFSHIHPDDKEGILLGYQQMLASKDTEWKCHYRFKRADGSVVNVISSSIVLRNNEGKAYRIIGSIQDISRQKILEEKLEMEINLKERQIAEAMKEAKETERSDIGKELHDNVNQLLGVSRLYIEMAKRGDENSEMYLARSSEYTLTAIEEIRKLTRGLASDIIKSLGLYDAIAKTASDTMEISSLQISVEAINFNEDSINEKFDNTAFRIVQEQLNNILKHADATRVVIRLTQTSESIILSISDNGIGFDTNQKSRGIGITNIKSRAKAYKGIADFVSQPGKGCVLTVTFPLRDGLLHKPE